MVMLRAMRHTYCGTLFHPQSHTEDAAAVVSAMISADGRVIPIAQGR
jgi:hypothetical protein